MNISEEIKQVEKHVEEINSILESLKQRLKNADKSFPDHQFIPCNDWHGRNEIPPVGKIWASDGVGIWLINSSGKGISESASAVKYWSIAFIPSPPNA